MSAKRVIVARRPFGSFPKWECVVRTSNGGTWNAGVSFWRRSRAEAEAEKIETWLHLADGGPE